MHHTIQRKKAKAQNFMVGALGRVVGPNNQPLIANASSSFILTSLFLGRTLLLLFFIIQIQPTTEVEDMKKLCHIPAFGDWDFSDGVPITQYFDSATNFFVEEKDLFPVPVQIIPAYAYHHQKIKVIKNVKGEIKEKKKQRKVCDLVTHEKPKKDEDKDLYRISPELIYQKPKRKRVANSFWFGCLGLNCIH